MNQKDLKELYIEKCYKYGDYSEGVLFKEIEYINGLQRMDRYSKYDFVITQNNKKNIYIELKTRSNKANVFDTTYFPIAKINNYINFRKSGDRYIIVIGFPNKNIDIINNTDGYEGLDIKYFFIEYRSRIFNTYKIVNDNICIEIKDLKPICDLYAVI